MSTFNMLTSLVNWISENTHTLAYWVAWLGLGLYCFLSVCARVDQVPFFWLKFFNYELTVFVWCWFFFVPQFYHRSKLFDFVVLEMNGKGEWISSRNCVFPSMKCGMLELTTRMCTIIIYIMFGTYDRPIKSNKCVRM